MVQLRTNMTDDTVPLRRQSRGAAIIIAGGAILLAFLIGLVTYWDAPLVVLLAGLIPVLLLYYGFKALRASKAGKQLLSEETRSAQLRAGMQSYWLLLGAIIVDELVRIFPPEELHNSFIYVGVIAYVVLLIYYNYI